MALDNGGRQYGNNVWGRESNEKNINHNESRKISQKKEPKDQRMKVEPSLPLGGDFIYPFNSQIK